jgi:hypothetical protein
MPQYQSLDSRERGKLRLIDSDLCIIGRRWPLKPEVKVSRSRDHAGACIAGPKQAERKSELTPVTSGRDPTHIADQRKGGTVHPGQLCMSGRTSQASSAERTVVRLGPAEIPSAILPPYLISCRPSDRSTGHRLTPKRKVAGRLRERAGGPGGDSA